MKIKKNGVTINLTESEVKKLSKRILKEQTGCQPFPPDNDPSGQIACLRADVDSIKSHLKI